MAETGNQVSFATYFKRAWSLSLSVEGKEICLDYFEVREEGVEGTSFVLPFSRASPSNINNTQ
jgi:hypothetical protein